jgi:hypothetical protein
VWWWVLHAQHVCKLVSANVSVALDSNFCPVVL